LLLTNIASKRSAGDPRITPRQTLASLFPTSSTGNDVRD
jgi:hypothetical protein